LVVAGVAECRRQAGQAKAQASMPSATDWRAGKWGSAGSLAVCDTCAPAARKGGEGAIQWGAGTDPPEVPEKERERERERNTQKPTHRNRNIIFPMRTMARIASLSAKQPCALSDCTGTPRWSRAVQQPSATVLRSAAQDRALSKALWVCLGLGRGRGSVRGQFFCAVPGGVFRGQLILPFWPKK
jgi:hypothetical protein